MKYVAKKILTRHDYCLVDVMRLMIIRHPFVMFGCQNFLTRHRIERREQLQFLNY